MVLMIEAEPLPESPMTKQAQLLKLQGGNVHVIQGYKPHREQVNGAGTCEAHGTNPRAGLIAACWECRQECEREQAEEFLTREGSVIRYTQYAEAITLGIAPGDVLRRTSRRLQGSPQPTIKVGACRLCITTRASPSAHLGQALTLQYPRTKSWSHHFEDSSHTTLAALKCKAPNAPSCLYRSKFPLTCQVGQGQIQDHLDIGPQATIQGVSACMDVRSMQYSSPHVV